ncbi:MAG: hypothetical protein WD648_00280, partial [Planctomycetaceae bacterium]
AMRCVGTSATMTSGGDSEEQARVVGEVASKIFGESISVSTVIGETLRRSTAECDFASESELLIRSLEVYRELKSRHAQLRSEVQASIASAERGEVTPLDIAELKAALR